MRAFLPVLQLIACASAAVSAEPVAVPAEHQVAMREVTWLAVNEATGVYRWRPGDGSDEWPDVLGRIEATELVWNHRFYPIQSFALVDDGPRVDGKPVDVVIRFELGTLRIRYRTARLRQFEFQARHGTTHVTFRNFGREWAATD